MLLQIETAVPTVYATIGGSSSHTVSFANEQIDVSDKDSSRWKELLAAGDRSISISMNGFVSSDANFALFFTAFTTDTITNFKVLYFGSKTIVGAFHIDSCDITGERNGAQTFTAKLTNSGAPTLA